MAENGLRDARYPKIIRFVDIYFSRFTSTLMTFYQNHHTMVKLKSNIWLLHPYIYLGVTSVVFKHFRVSLAACVINFHLEHSFSIEINKNIISYFNTVKMLFVILLPIPCKKVKHPSFLTHFGRQIKDKWWLGEGLGRCDR